MVLLGLGFVFKGEKKGGVKLPRRSSLFLGVGIEEVSFKLVGYEAILKVG